MAIAFAEVKTHSRKYGHSAVAASAYRTRSRLVDERTGEVFDWSDRADELETTRIVPPNAARVWLDERRSAGLSQEEIRSQLWNDVERSERRYDSRIGRDNTVAMPWELTAAQRARVSYEIARGMAERHDTAVEFSIHKPHEYGGPEALNYHTHFHITPRRMDASGFTEKARELDLKTESGPHIEAWRQIAQHAINRALERAGWDESHMIDMRSYERQGLDREGQIHMGPEAAALERDGTRTKVAEHNREVAERNAAKARQERRAALPDKGNVIDFEEKMAQRDRQRHRDMMQRHQALREGRLQQGLQRLSRIENEIKAKREAQELEQTRQPEVIDPEERQRRADKAREYERIMAWEKRDLAERQRLERRKLAREQKTQADRAEQDLQSRFRSGFFGWWDKITGKHERIEAENEQAREDMRRREEDERKELEERQRQQLKLQAERHAKMEREREEILEYGEAQGLRHTFGREAGMARDGPGQGQQRQSGTERGLSMGLG